MFKKPWELTYDDKLKIAEMSRETTLCMLNGESLDYMSKKLKLQPYQVIWNMEEQVYLLKRHIGLRRCLKILFMK